MKMKVGMAVILYSAATSSMSSTSTWHWSWTSDQTATSTFEFQDGENLDEDHVLQRLVQFLKNRCDHLARPAPGCKKVNNHQFLPSRGKLKSAQMKLASNSKAGDCAPGSWSHQCQSQRGPSWLQWAQFCNSLYMTKGNSNPNIQFNLRKKHQSYGVTNDETKVLGYNRSSCGWVSEKVSHNFDKQYDNNLLDVFELNTNIFSHHALLNQCLGKLNNEWGVVMTPFLTGFGRRCSFTGHLTAGILDLNATCYLSPDFLSALPKPHRATFQQAGCMVGSVVWKFLPWPQYLLDQSIPGPSAQAVSWSE